MYFEKFYNNSVSNGCELGQEYMIWSQLISHPEKRQPGFQSICDAPFILTPVAKANITHVTIRIVPKAKPKR